MKRIDELLALMTNAGASDLHLKAERPPILRVDGLLRVTSEPVVSVRDLESIQGDMLTPAQRDRLAREHELDASYQPASVPDRFRLNCFIRMGMPGMVMRRVPRQVPSLEELGFKATLKTLAHSEHGLVLLTGPTGSGKSTTLAAMLRELNETEPLHVVTIEDPIEFVQDDRQCVINQREVGIDTESFTEALRRALRQDPDVILVGEMRDAETIRIATMAAETGHLVLSTLHTNDAKQSVDRIINAFPPEEQLQMRLKLSVTLRGIVCQSLVPRQDGKGRVCIQEILVCTPYVQELIKKGDLSKIDDAIRDAPAVIGMQSKNDSLYTAWAAGDIRDTDALAFSNRPTDLELRIRTARFEQERAAAAPPPPPPESSPSPSPATAPEPAVPPEPVLPPPAPEKPAGSSARWPFRRK
ncbi:MAG: PilT/PilU family type 4a pilus ATPase [Kiritimatiellae bacterium]|nr:PilT/PilU family type 4a pilus ATPase [Kiritimatiellia bacterium]